MKGTLLAVGGKLTYALWMFQSDSWVTNSATTLDEADKHREWLSNQDSTCLGLCIHPTSNKAATSLGLLPAWSCTHVPLWTREQISLPVTTISDSPFIDSFYIYIYIFQDIHGTGVRASIQYRLVWDICAVKQALSSERMFRDNPLFVILWLYDYG